MSTACCYFRACCNKPLIFLPHIKLKTAPSNLAIAIMSKKSDNSGFHSQFARKINNVHTEFVMHKFTNKWFLLVTQFAGIPNLYTVEFQPNHEARIQTAPTIVDVHVPISITCKFGADKDEMCASIQYLIDKSNLKLCPQQLLVSIGLKEYNKKNLEEITAVINEIC